MSTEPEHTPLPKPPRTWLTLLMGAVLLISGAVMGSVVTLNVIQKNIQQRSEGPPPRFSDKIIQKLSTDLELTADQEKEIRSIFETNHQRFNELKKEIHSQVEEELGSVHDRVEAVLTPEQSKIWNARFKEMRMRSFPGFRDRRGEYQHRDRNGGDREQQRYHEKSQSSNSDAEDALTEESPSTTQPE